jgi:DNA (cytosine-5)-methyltransferase 1
MQIRAVPSAVRAIDLFAGWGGFTQGAEEAGAQVVWAANHWPLAVRAHKANHPHVAHECQDLRQADWTRLPSYDVLLASPACQGHSQASQPRRRRYHDAMRATAWAVVDCADVTEPKAIVIENVVDFRRWRLFPDWRSALERLGYRLAEHVVTATNHGVPQRRNRLFIVGTRRRRPLDLDLPRVEVEPAFGPCIDWTAGGWRPIAACRGPGARERMLRARARLGDRCLVQSVTGHPGVPLSEAIRTITTKDQWVLVDGDRYRPLLVREYARGMGFPDSYRWPDDVGRADTIKGLGNAVCPPVARDVVAQVIAAA